MTVYQHAIGMTVYVIAGILLLLAVIFSAVGIALSIAAVVVIACLVLKGLLTK